MEIDWATLRRLRAGFLEGTAGQHDYWRSVPDLAQYDATFAQRIGWKWDFVLNDLNQLGWQPPAGTLLDWGCGSGVASRACLDYFGTRLITELGLSDRSQLAVEFAINRAREKYPDLPVHAGFPETVDLLVVSHVSTELEQRGFDDLYEIARGAQAVIWVEPGTFPASRQLIQLRERLRDRFNLVAPCPHQNSCGLLAVGNESHWCHQFAEPPPFVFTDPFWAKFSQTMEIDLRSLPVSYLVLDRRPIEALPNDAVRVLGRPEILKPHVRLLGCGESGIREGIVTKRNNATEFRQLRKGRLLSLQRWQCDGQEITRLSGVHRASNPHADSAL